MIGSKNDPKKGGNPENLQVDAKWGEEPDLALFFSTVVLELQFLAFDCYQSDKCCQQLQCLQ